jgi:hypothetical protein
LESVVAAAATLAAEEKVITVPFWLPEMAVVSSTALAKMPPMVTAAFALLWWSH